MIPEIRALKALDLPEAIADAACLFVENPDPAIPQSVSVFPHSWQMAHIGKSFTSTMAWNQNTRLLLRFFVHMADAKVPQGNPSCAFLSGAMQALCEKESSLAPAIIAEAVGEIRSYHTTLDHFLTDFISTHSYGHDWSVRAEPDAHEPFQNPAVNLIYQAVVNAKGMTPEVLCNHSALLAVLSIHQPEITSDWCRKSVSLNIYNARPGWLSILRYSSAYDSLCLEYCSAVLDNTPQAAFPILYYLHLNRGGCYLDLVLDAAQRPKAAQDYHAVEMLLKHRNAQIIDIMARAFAEDNASDHVSGIDEPPYGQLFDLMIERWDQSGEVLFKNFVSSQNAYGIRQKLVDPLHRLGPTHFPALRKTIHDFMGGLKAIEQTELWHTLSETHPAAFIEDFDALLIGKSKPQREIAATALARLRGAAALLDAHNLLVSKKSDTRLGALALIERIADPSSVTPLRTALENESSDGVRAAIHQALKACGQVLEMPAQVVGASEAFDLDSLLTRNSKGLKIPSCSWLVIASLPSLTATDGAILPVTAITFLIAKQSKDKGITAAPDILPLLAHIDREKSAPFATALVEGFLNSEQAASDRWALTLGGLLGDKRIINLLLPRIQGWCENSRHKLAEYAAQAISLLPGNEPLMVLDTLANRYRTKFKNIGSACSAAFNAAATARGITPDELGDMVVPTFGFDADGVRRFDWEGGGISAELGADFKITWFDPDTDKSWKTLPANASDDTKAEVKTITKLIRETVKSQTARLEMSLVRQRRWPVARWKELFENHPLLRSFASGLVWGVHDVSGGLQRTFRRYPNGILADAKGVVEELTETDTTIGMAHPLELDQPSIDLWRAHFLRMKVKQPFTQIDRPAELMDQLHGNRRSIVLTDRKKLSAGTFRSRAEKRGWTRGSVVDAGGISSYYKLYPGAGIEVILPTQNFWVGCDPMEEIELESAYFATAGSVERGSYIYDEPAPDDLRVLRFDQVPPVVFSETITDLKAITATKE